MCNESHIEERARVPGQTPDGLSLIRLERSGGCVDDAQCSDGMTVRGAERHSRVEPDLGLLMHERIVFEAWIRNCIRDNHDVGLEDRVRAERDITRSLRLKYANARLEPLTMFVHKADVGDRRLANVRRESGQIVIALFRISVQQFQSSKGVESF